jgi:hypothetical protein
MPATTLRRLCPASRLVEVAPQLHPGLAIWCYVASGSGSRSVSFTGAHAQHASNRLRGKHGRLEGATGAPEQVTWDSSYHAHHVTQAHPMHPARG